MREHTLYAAVGIAAVTVAFAPLTRSTLNLISCVRIWFARMQDCPAGVPTKCNAQCAQVSNTMKTACESQMGNVPGVAAEVLTALASIIQLCDAHNGH